MLRTENLAFTYPKGASFNFPDWKAEQGEQWLVSGISGSGKTTFLHLLAGLIRPHSGKIFINEKSINQMPQSQLDRFRGGNIGMIFQKNYFINSINMKQNLLVTQTLPGFEKDLVYFDELIAELGIDDKQHQRPTTLSQGELQRFSVARALVNKPAILMADEPTSSLDDANCDAFVKLITSVASRYRTILIIATHDARLKRIFNTRYELQKA